MYNPANAMARRRATRAGAPSQYPRILFHALRSAQLLSSIVVSGIMCYFMYYLHMEKYPIPWTFIVLLTISIATMVSLLMTIILYNFTYLSPIFNLALNGSLSVVWALGLGLLSWSLSETLKKACDISEWGSEAGVMICRDYKALWSFTLIGLVSTISALCLDIYTNRKATKRGAYILPEDDKVTLRMENMLANNSRARGQGYDDEIEEIPAEEGVMLPQMDTQTAYQSAYAHEMDTSYHSSYSHEEHGHTTDIGKHGRFHDYGKCRIVLDSTKYLRD